MDDKKRTESQTLLENLYQTQSVKDVNANSERYKKFAATRPQVSDNPLYGGSPFEPSSFIPKIYGDPALAQPLPSGRYPDPSIPSPASNLRASQVTEFKNNAPEYVRTHTVELNNEQSVIDKGKEFLGRLFDYTDEPDLTLFGIPLGPVESVFDSSIKHITGFYDLLNIGYAGIVSAMPGGVETYPFEELSGGKSVGEVLGGEFEWGSAPSAGQIAVTSVGIEAARIRSGGKRLSDILLANPATGPFILAALLADTSPLQQPGFDLLNDEQREKAFASGWEKWGSGVTDFGLMFADPNIGAGVGFKVARAGLLGVNKGAKYGIDFASAIDNAAEEVSVASGMKPGQVAEEISDLTTIGQTVKPVGEKVIGLPDAPLLTGIPYGTARPNYRNPLSQVIHDVLEVDKNGTKVMSAVDVSTRPEIRAANALAPALGALLHAADSVPLVVAVLKVFAGTPKALDEVAKLNKGMADTLFRMQREHYDDLARLEPEKAAVIAESLNVQIKNLTDEIAANTRTLRDLTDPNARRAIASETMAADYGLRKATEAKRLINQQTLDEATELFEIIAGRRTIDKLDATSTKYDPAIAKEIVESYRSARTVLNRLIEQEMQGAALEARFQFATRSNFYSRAVTKSRGRRGKAAYQYGAEKTSIFPHMRQIGVVGGKAIQRRDGWFTASEFPGVTRFGRNVRIWRWAGTATPSGYVGMKGVNAVNSEVEMQAALDLDIYSGAGIEVTKPMFNPDGSVIIKNGVQKTETIIYGGIARRDELLARWMSGVNDPTVDNYDMLQQIEKDIIGDFANAYGIDTVHSDKLFMRADKTRMQILDSLEETGYWVDPRNATMHEMPYAQTSLATGTYMHNFAAYERELMRYAQEPGGLQQLRQMFEIPAHLATSAYAAFEQVWRPATLLRVSYTARNLTENLIRAAVYQASFAPLTWPIRATTNGIRNSIIKRASERAVTATQRVIDQSDYGSYLREYMTANSERRILDMAVESVDVATGKPAFYVGDLTKMQKGYTEAEYSLLRGKSEDRVRAAKEAIEEGAAKFDAAVKGTKFGVWRDKQIKALNEHILEEDAFNNIMTETFNDANMSVEALDELMEVVAVHVLSTTKRDMLLYDSAKALTEWRVSSMGRQRRIGSGTSLGPGANYYLRAFEGPYEGVNRAAVSADITVKNLLSVQSTASDNLFRRAMRMSDQVVLYDPSDPVSMSSWRSGMANFLEQSSSNSTVRKLEEFNWDVDKTAAWLRTAEGNDEYKYIVHILNRREPNKKYGKIVKGKMAAKVDPNTGQIIHRDFSTEINLDLDDLGKPIPGGSTLLTLSDKELKTYIMDIRDKTIIGVQNPVFMDLLSRRIQSKRYAAQPNRLPTTAINAALNEQDIKGALDQMNPVERSQLGAVKGEMLIVEGIDSLKNVYKKIVSAMFNVANTIPEDAIARGPFYSARFTVMRNVLLEEYLIRSGQSSVLKKGKAKSHSGRTQDQTLSHEAVKIPKGELERIYSMAHKRALADTKEWLYTIERRTNLGKYGEWFSPFISAQQNSVTTIGKLLWKEPWLAPAILDVWRAPTRLGIEDEDGNLTLPMPSSWIRDWLNDHPEIPVVGGIMDYSDTLTIPKDSFNVMLPETGYGWSPRPSSFIQMTASELMKRNLVPLETPQILKTMFGDKEGTEFYAIFQDYMFGEQGTVSSKSLSYDKIIPAYLQKLLISQDSTSEEYQKEYQKQLLTQNLRTYARERDDYATPEEIGQRTTNAFFFQLFGNQGIPTPLTPYPVLGRPRINGPLGVLQEVQQRYREADFENANMNMSVQLGDWALPSAAKSVTANVGGAEPYASVLSDIKTFDSLIAKAVPLIGDNLDVLGILVNNRVDQSTYEGSATQWLKSTRIAGQSEAWYENQSAEQVTADRQITAGYVLYNQFKDAQDAQMYSAGIASTESIAGFPYKQATQRFLLSMSNNPEYKAWYTDFKDTGGDRTGAAYRVIELAIDDPTFNRVLIESGKTQLLANMQQYVYARRGVRNEVQASGVSINDPANARLKETWAIIQQQLVNSDTRWATIFHRYLSRDEVSVMPNGQLGQADLPYAGTGMPLMEQELERVG